ncbi:MAG: hypothetical protein JWM41_2070 [Gemmatimonadetes bacterium]|nr:hypothetical protein [Gemmatimonadota bacterium]
MAPSPIDVVVIGAGPAGTAAARLLATWGHSVVVLGRASTGHALAESLPPSCTKLFEQIGVRAAIDSAGFIRATGNTVQWADRDRRAESFDAGALGYQVPRDAFDTLLLGAAEEAGATLYANTLARDVTRAGDEWSVTYDAPTGRHAVRARWVLDCSGRAGVVARRGWRRPEPAARTTAIVGVWETRAPWPVEDDSHTLVESYDGGWAWSVPVSAGRRFVTVMLDPSITSVPGRAELADAYRAELARTTMIRDLVADAALVAAPWGCDASPYSAERVCDDGILLVGDAASFVDPLSSFGIKKALASAWLASVAVHTAIADSTMTAPAMQLFADREREMYDHLQRQSAALSREAAGAHTSDFWRGRGEAHWEVRSNELDVAALRADPRVLSAFEEIKRRPALALKAGDALEIVDRAMVRGHRVVLEQHLMGPQLERAVRYCRNVDLVLITALVGRYDQVPDLFDAYNRAAPPAGLPDFLGALSTLVGLDMLTFA